MLTADDLLYPAVAQADDLTNVAVAEAPDVGFADRCIAGFAGRFVPSGGGGELSPGIGHAEKCTEKLTGGQKAYRFLYMENARYIVQPGPTGFHIVDTQTGEDLGAFHARWKAEAKAAELNG